MADAQGRVTVLEVYRCDFPGCAKLFQSRGALHTHQVRPLPLITDTTRLVPVPAQLGWHCAGAGLAQAQSARRADVHGPAGTEAPGDSHGRDTAKTFAP